MQTTIVSLRVIFHCQVFWGHMQHQIFVATVWLCCCSAVWSIWFIPSPSLHWRHCGCRTLVITFAANISHRTSMVTSQQRGNALFIWNQLIFYFNHYYSEAWLTWCGQKVCFLQWIHLLLYQSLRQINVHWPWLWLSVDIRYCFAHVFQVLIMVLDDVGREGGGGLHGLHVCLRSVVGKEKRSKGANKNYLTA